MGHNQGNWWAQCLPRASLLAFVFVGVAAVPVPAAGGDGKCDTRDTCVNALYHKLALINGGPAEINGTIVTREPLICFPRAASTLSGQAWSSDKKRPAAIIREIKELGALLVTAYRDSGTPEKPRILVRVSGFADSEGGDESNLKLSYQRAQTIAALLRQSVPSVPLTLEVEGRGQAKGNSGGGGACADPVRPATEAAGEPAPQPSHRRVEIEILSGTLTHASAPSIESDDLALRLFPEGNTPGRPFRLTLAEGELRVKAVSEACRALIAPTPAAAAGNHPPDEFDYPSTPWVELARPGGSVDPSKYPLHQFEPKLSGSVGAFPVRRQKGSQTTDGVRIVLQLAKAESTPYLIPGYWAVALHLATLPEKFVLPDGNPAKEPWEKIVGCYASIAAGGTAPKLVDESQKVLNGQIVSQVMSRLPKTIDGMMLHTHRVDRNFHFFDVHPGMSLRFKSTIVDAVSRTMQPGGPMDLVTQPDPVDPYALIPQPRKITTPRGRSTSDLFLAYMLSGKLDRPSGDGTESAEAAPEAAATSNRRALASHVVFEDLLQQGVVRVFLPRNLRLFQTISSVPGTPQQFRPATWRARQQPSHADRFGARSGGIGQIYR